MTRTAGSRPFLNLLNPMGRHYQGYEAAASLLEEDEDEDDANNGRDHDALMTPTQRTDRLRLGELRPNDKRQEPQDSSDDEPSQSYMIEETRPEPSSSKPRRHNTKPSAPRNPPKSRPITSDRHTPLLPTHLDASTMPPRPSEIDEPEDTSSYQTPPPRQGLDPRERALWHWVNVYNLDAYLQEVYAYYEGKGIYCIALSRGLNLLTVSFVVAFSTFLLGCVDYSRFRLHTTLHLSDVVVDHCVSKFTGFSFLFFLFFCAFWIWNLVTFAFGILRLLDMYRFYTYLLGIPDADIQTISWPEIVRRIAAIRDQNPLTAMSSDQQVHADSVPTAKLDAHDIANRIMRQENYLIALFNKELLDLRVPVPEVAKPYFGSKIGNEATKGQTLTRALEWNLRFCVMGYLFDDGGRVRKMFLKEKNREVLIESLRRRFIFMGVLNAIFAPFIVLYHIMYSFFRYFEEYHKNPSSIGGRAYSPFAQWKFREFNELPHHFTRRLNESYPVAVEYINQFPNEKTALIMRFVAFVSGSFVAVLFLATAIDPDLFLHFEISPHRTVLYYLGVFGSILAVARGMVPDKNRVFDPELLMMELIRYTHYMPNEWKRKLHSQMVHQEFGRLFPMKIAIFVEEIVSVVLTPFILWFTLPDCAPKIVDFFREFTVHVDGLGHVCSFAVFDFQRHGNVKFGAPSNAADERLASKEGKMEKSFLNFKAMNPDWVPNDPSGSLYLSKLADFSARNQRPGMFGTHRGRRRFVNDSIGIPIMPEQPDPTSANPNPVLAERAQQYERALQMSLNASTARRRPVGSPSSGGRLADSTEIHPDDRAPDGGIDSQLGESYVGDVQTRGGMLIDRDKPYAEQSQEELEGDEVLQRAGIMALLTQIYDQQRQVI
ncbi:APG9-domain-containing protein [Sistotremastrum niveocremeum HHB9708]|uniref:Autophagy-related protein 9 n=1 Tax=Sistotremastrum niveocremeum HHB9708 TaxID=1314777 RepID=A0A164P483_9AGAM|nr:APG9-domain-containing protein [Sistotremastrum niveocremeum HHB9708]